MLDHLDIVRGRRHLHVHVPLMGLHHTANVSKFVSSFLSLSPGSGVSFCHLSLVTCLSYCVIVRGNISFASWYFKQWRRKQLSVTLTTVCHLSVYHVPFCSSVVSDSVSGQVQHSFYTSKWGEIVFGYCSLVKGSVASGLDYQSLICSSQAVSVCWW